MIAFMNEKGTRAERIDKAMSNMGSNVIVGIACTKFIGVIVLNFASVYIFRIYYFRMYLSIILLSCFNGLMVMPTILRWVGPVRTKYKYDRKVS
jgi:Niemann-Pick C1 protein